VFLKIQIILDVIAGEGQIVTGLIYSKNGGTNVIKGNEKRKMN
jgi:hypothetical protein